MRFKDVQCRKTWVINVHYGLQHSVQLLTHKHLPCTSIWHNREQWELFNLNYKMSDRIYAPATFLTSSHKTLKQIMCDMHQLTNDSYTLGRQGTNSKIPLLLEETATLTQHENVTLLKKMLHFYNVIYYAWGKNTYMYTSQCSRWNSIMCKSVKLYQLLIDFKKQQHSRNFQMFVVVLCNHPHLVLKSVSSHWYINVAIFSICPFH